MGQTGRIGALLRQDPDIIMIGEVRDLATAEMAVQAALTGHLVFTTMHHQPSLDYWNWGFPPISSKRLWWALWRRGWFVFCVLIVNGRQISTMKHGDH
jgi:hypothetical protein